MSRLLLAIKPWLRALLALQMVAVGVLHFVDPTPFVRIVPSALPDPLLLVQVSGAAEMLLGALLLVPALRRLAGVGLILLYVAVFPANVNMAVNAISLDGGPPLPDWALWGRLPLQVLLIVWAYWVAVLREPSK